MRSEAAVLPAIEDRLAPVVEVRDVTKRYGGVTALGHASLEVRSGETLALVGDNGAGKSTLVKLLTGLIRPDEGEIRIGGAAMRLHSAEEARRLGIETVHQTLALADHQTVFMNMFLGRELVCGPLRRLDKRRMREQSRQILSELKVSVPSVNVPIGALSGGQRQCVAIGRATHWATRIVLMDEPTAALGVQESGQVEEVIRSLQQRGLTVVLVSHNLDQVFRLARRVCVLRRGSLVAQRLIEETDREEVVALITGALER
jgi:simple sugar transport system ATP-binding protein